MKYLPFTKPFVYNESILSKFIKTTSLISSILYIINANNDKAIKFDSFINSRNDYMNLRDVEQNIYDDKRLIMEGSLGEYNIAKNNYYASLGVLLLSYGLSIGTTF